MSRGHASYDTGKPDSGLEEGTSKIKTLQSTVDENAALERTQLELEIAERKEERTQRKSHSGHANFAFQHATEVDSEGNRVYIPSHRPPPTSLAEFIGGRASSPRLTKHKHQENVHDPAAYDPRPYTDARSPLLEVARGMIRERNAQNPLGGVRMPGMTSGTVLAGSQHVSSSSPLTESGGGPPRSSQIEARQLNNPSAAMTPAKASSQTPVFQTPRASPGLLSPSFSKEAPEKVLPPSLTKIQDRGFVNERVKADDSMVQASAAALPSTEGDGGTLQPPAFPLRKRPALDRWPPPTGAPREKSSIDPLPLSPGERKFSDMSNSDPTNLPVKDSGVIQERVSSEWTSVPSATRGTNPEITTIPFASLDEMKSELVHIGGSEDSDTPNGLQRRGKSIVESTGHIVNTWGNQRASLITIPPLADAALSRGTGIKHGPTMTSVECRTVSERANATPIRPSPVKVDGPGTLSPQDGDQLAVPPIDDQRVESQSEPERIVFPSVKALVEASNSKHSAPVVTQRSVEVLSLAPRPSPTRRKSSFDKYPAVIPLPPALDLPTPPTRVSREEVAISEIAKSASASQVDEPLPPLDLKSILQFASAKPPLSFNSAYTPVSTDVFSIRGRDAIPVSSHPYIFYDTELRAIVYRCKDPQSNGLTSTVIWIWQGKNAVLGEQEAWKIRDLESHFCTKVVCCCQGGEPYDLIGLLGGVVAIRHGTHSIWTNEEASMHCVRDTGFGGSIVIDEVDLSISNLCSAFSYVIVVLGQVYVWHGRGSLPTEQSQAMSYAALISADSLPVTELNEGAEDSMFWTYLGDGHWASAGFWSERRAMQRRAQCTWRVEFSRIHFIPFFGDWDFDHGAIYVIDGILELFILVGKDARSQRNNIRLALALAEGISSATADQRPFEAPVHVVIFPSQLPLDLRVGHTRFLDEAIVNGGDCPNHLNLLELGKAKAQLARSTWTADRIDDASFLPLGVAP